MKILITCPPMIGMLDAFRPHFESAGATAHCPAVVQTLSEEQLIALVPEYDGWIIGDDPATSWVFAAGRAGRLKAAVKWGVGVDNIDFAGAREVGIQVTNTPGMFGADVADLAMAYVVALARQTHLIDAAVKHGEWPKPRGVSLAGKILGLVGFGDIGRNIASRARAAEMSIIAYDPAYQNARELPAVRFSVWPEHIAECDFLVLACTLNATNRHMLNERALTLMKPGLRVVNVARGGLIDESALAAALERGVVHSAALDVFEIEPLPSASPLRRYPQCLFSSHNASNTSEAVTRTSLRAIAMLFDSLQLRGT